jgi:putative hydrolase of the HAD superfamily
LSEDKDTANPAKGAYAAPRAVVFDLGGTLVDWHDWDAQTPERWAKAHGHLRATLARESWPARDNFVEAMMVAEAAHWQRVEHEHWSGPPSGVVTEGLRALGMHAHEAEILAVLDGYARAVDGEAFVFPDSAPTLQWLRERGYRIGLLSNTWWAAEWHNADLATHGLAGLIDELVYTSDLPHSKPHRSVFEHVAELLGQAPEACVMVGDRPIDDIAGALGAGMRAVWKTNGSPRPKPDTIIPTATIRDLGELPALLEAWRG